MSIKTKRIITGVLWIFSGVIVLIVAVITSVLLNFVLSDPGSSEAKVKLVSNLIAWTLGSAGVVLLVLGPIVGIKILTQKG